MSMNDYSGGSGDIVGQRKQKMRKHVYTARTSGAVAVVSLVAGLILDIPLLSVVIPIIAAIVFIYSGMQIKKILDHKDEW